MNPARILPWSAFVVLALAGPARAAHIIQVERPGDQAKDRAPAEPAPTPSASPTASGAGPIRSYAAAMIESGVKGPRQIALDGRASFALASREIFVGQPALNAALEGLGDPAWPDVVGMITSEDGPSAYRAVVSTASDGFIKSEAALAFAPEDWLSRLRQGRQAIDGALLDHGFSGVTYVSWRVPPTYDPKKRTLDWSVVERDFDGALTLVRHHALLDRGGYVAIDVFADAARAAETDKIAAALFNGLSSDAAHGYSAFDAVKDPTAPYGVADLVSGAELKAPQFSAARPKDGGARTSAESSGSKPFGGFHLHYLALLGVAISGLRLATSKQGMAAKSLFVLIMTGSAMRFLGVV